MSVPAYLLVPDGRATPRARPCSPSTATARASPGSAGSSRPRAPNGDYAAELARRGHVVLAPDLRCFGERADWNPPDHYACDTNLVHPVMAGWSPLTQNLWDLARCLDVLAAHPLVDPARIGRGRVLLRRDHDPVPRRLRRPGGRRRGERLLLVVGRVAQGAVEHVRLPGAARHARPDRARRPRRAGRAPAAAGRDRSRGPAVPGGRGARPRRGPAPAGLRPPRRARRGSSTTCSTASTSGTGPSPTPSSTAGCRPPTGSAGPRTGRYAGPAAGDPSRAARPSRGRGRRWRGPSAQDRRRARGRRPARSRAARHRRRLAAPRARRRAPGAARSRAGMVTVMACAGHVVDGGEVALVHLLAPAGRRRARRP